ncbi:MAG: glycosyltransferase family 2 protein, partial [Thermoanaerobaculia bacterium]
MPELTVVVPVYNEEQLVGDAVETLAQTLEGVHIDYEIRLYDDGSRDGTNAVLRQLATGNERITVIAKPNSGHGPTIARGYREAAGDWIFQMDSDGEMPAEQMLSLWKRRAEFDFLIGRRVSRR